MKGYEITIKIKIKTPQHMITKYFVDDLKEGIATQIQKTNEIHGLNVTLYKPRVKKIK